jgi:hypothetical protein
MAADTAGAARGRFPNVRVAAWLSVVPGLGQLYNGQPVKACLYLFGTLLSIGPSVVLITKGEGVGHGLLSAHAYVLFFVIAFVSVLVFLALFVLGLFIWASAAVDARRSALALRAGRTEEAAQNWFFRL